MQQSQINPESLAILVVVPIGFVVMVIVAIIYARKYFRQKDKEKQLYENISRQMNWNFSLRGEELETAKPYFEYLNRQILPDRLRLGVFPVNILWGNAENALFAAFDYNYNNNPNSNNYNLRHEKGFLLVSKNLNSPAFEILEKDFLSKGFAVISGDSISSNFARNYQIKTQNPSIADKLSASEVAQMFEDSEIIRVLGNGNMLCVFFRRTAEDLPDLSRIQFQLNIVWQMAGFFGMKN
jgi:hypothetical protein